MLLNLKAEEALQKFLQSKEEMSDAILQTDQSLTEKKKEIEVECVKAEAAKATAKMQEEIQQQNEQLLVQKENTHEEHMKELTEKLEKAKAQTREIQHKSEHLMQQSEKIYKETIKELTEKMEKVGAQTREMQQHN
ncbi:Interferon-induced guanylate-binding 1 [Sigmodon hispidus]